MSDAFYKDMANVALGVITDFQQGVLVLEKRTPVAGADQPWDPGTPTPQPFSVVGVVQAVDRRYVDGTLVLATDRMAIIPTDALPASVVPTMTDRLIIDGESTVIKKVLRVPEAGKTIVYRLILGS